MDSRSLFSDGLTYNEKLGFLEEGISCDFLGNGKMIAKASRIATHSQFLSGFFFIILSFKLSVYATYLYIEIFLTIFARTYFFYFKF